MSVIVNPGFSANAALNALPGLAPRGAMPDQEDLELAAQLLGHVRGTDLGRVSESLRPASAIPQGVQDGDPSRLNRTQHQTVPRQQAHPRGVTLSPTAEGFERQSHHPPATSNGQVCRYACDVLSACPTEQLCALDGH